MKVRYGLLVILLMTLLNGCISTNRLTTINYQQNYAATDIKEPFRHLLVHQNDSVTTLIFEVDYPQLTYKKQKTSGNYLARYQLAFQVYPGIQSNKVSDSASFEFADSLHFATYQKDIKKIPIKIHDSSAVFVHLKFKDLQANKSFQYFREVHKSPSDRYNFLIKKPSGAIHFPSFKRYYHQYRFAYRSNPEHPLKATLYHPNKKHIALPPFTALPPDHPIIEDTENIAIENGVVNLRDKEGLLVVQNKKSSKDGYPFLCSNPSYPEIESIKEKIATLRYITTNKEYLRLSTANNAQEAYQQFWHRAAGDYDRAYRKMDSYEKRVVFANTYFTVVSEGWKSDRGMIYIIFGAPDQVLKYQGQEKWRYTMSGNSLEFVFKQKESPFGIMEFYLERKEQYRIPWYQKVEYWKN